MSEHSTSIRDARAHLSELITKAQHGAPTVLTRNGSPAAAIVPIEDLEALEDAMDAYLARQADLEEGEAGPAVGMAGMAAEVFDESRGSAA
ncbi:type II toxin-antitoxin system Phd/YefM family antitoxin [Nocardiopsis terrae]